MPKISVVIPYYEAPQMLSMQLWEMFWYRHTEGIEIIIVDDASPTYPAKNVIENTRKFGKRFHTDAQLFRIKKDIPWNQHAARNLGAYVATGEWLLMIDICRVMHVWDMEKLLNYPLDPACFYKFAGKQMPSGERTYQACNSLLVRKEDYWKVGGYNEATCGTYGGDSTLVGPLKKLRKWTNFDDIYLHYYDTMYPDSKAPFSRKEGEYREKYLELVRKGMPRKEPLQFEWERII